MDIAIQIAGSILILLAYALAQFRVLSPASVRYLVLNIVGSGVLGTLAIVTFQWGFALLECVWSVVSLTSLVLAVRERIRSRRAPETS